MTFEEVEKKLRDKIIGQPEATNQLAKLYFKVLSGVRPSENRPIDSIYLAGPSGVGKTESVLAFMSLFGAGYDKLFKIDGGGYQHGHEIASLIGSPPGYQGFDSTKGMLHQNMMKQKLVEYPAPLSGLMRPLYFILIDEAEKAHEKLHNAFLSILDKGTLAMGDNTVSDFSSSLIFFTANLGNDALERSRKASGFVKTSVSPQSAFKNAYEKAFRPEYRGRINKTITYSYLTEANLFDIIDVWLRKIEKQFLAAGYLFYLEMSDASKRHLIKQNRNDSEGARAIIKVLENEVQDNLIILSQTKKLSSPISLEVSSSGKISFGLKAAITTA